MYKTFQDLESLMAAVKLDKMAEGPGASIANRYPVRFVLFDNFKDCYEFVDKLPADIFVQSVNSWLDSDYPDTILTHSRLANNIKDFIKLGKDSVISPFSELARFYDNNVNKEFESIIKTVKAVETHKETEKSHQRVYIPIVGLEGKMSTYYDDSQTFIWYFKNPDKELSYHLILTNGTNYGIKGLDKKYTVVNSVKDWLSIWKDQGLKNDIICTSRAIFANAAYAQPDNAFDYTICSDVHEFLDNGLHLPLGIIYKQGDDAFWMEFAKDTDISDFNIDNYFNSRFGIYQLADYQVFFNAWFKNSDPYMRWLLREYYSFKFCEKGYICEVIKNCKCNTDSELVIHMLVDIFDLENQENYLDERAACLDFISSLDVLLPEINQEALTENLENVASSKGYSTAVRYLSTVTDAEKELIINWLAADKVSRADIQQIYPDLYYYFGRTFGSVDPAMGWCLDYFDKYKAAKLANSLEPALTILKDRNASEITFNSWYSQLKTTRSILTSRSDIDSYFWIDGLGMEWVPFIAQVIKEKNNNGFYLNEVLVAKALLPTVTDVNKVDLEKLTGGKLDKYGDLDEMSHKIRHYPEYIVEDLKKIKIAINMILDENPGKKLAIISDHGVSYLPQRSTGLNLAGVTGRHEGRYATWNNGKAVSDSKYKILDDEITICSLGYESLSSKVDEGKGCHGGCTPEEVIVPIFIISDSKVSTHFNASILSEKISGSNPFVRFKITGTQSIDIPYVMYDGTRYELTKVGDDVFESDALLLKQDVQTISLNIQEDEFKFNVNIDLGAEEEEDLFS